MRQFSIYPNTMLLLMLAVRLVCVGVNEADGAGEEAVVGRSGGVSAAGHIKRKLRHVMQASVTG